MEINGTRKLWGSGKMSLFPKKVEYPFKRHFKSLTHNP